MLYVCLITVDFVNRRHGPAQDQSQCVQAAGQRSRERHSEEEFY